MPLRTFINAICFGLLIATLSADSLTAKSPWQWVTFRREVGDKQARMTLTDKDGPWLIFAASFAGEGAESEARQLVDELRGRYKLPAYIHSHEFDFSDSVQGIGINPDRTPKRMRYDKSGVFEEYAVLVGDFNSIDDPDLQKTLKEVKYAQPSCLTKNVAKTTRRFAGLRELNRRINGDQEKKRKGPMGTAFATPNPMIPREFFAPKGVDSEVIKWNQGVKFSLLECPGKYTVRVATFRGNVVIDQEEVAEIEKGGEMKSRLEEAADKANKVTTALRKQGIEAYEFHDRHESYVTVGSFESVGDALPDGRQEMNPDILVVMQRYAPSKTPLVDNSGQQVAGIQPRVIDGIALDVQPWPVEVPRRSIAVDYNR